MYLDFSGLTAVVDNIKDWVKSYVSDNSGSSGNEEYDEALNEIVRITTLQHERKFYSFSPDSSFGNIIINMTLYNTDDISDGMFIKFFNDIYSKFHGESWSGAYNTTYKDINGNTVNNIKLFEQYSAPEYLRCAQLQVFDENDNIIFNIKYSRDDNRIVSRTGSYASEIEYVITILFDGGTA